MAALLEKGIPVKAVLRSEEKARTLFGEHDPKKFQVPFLSLHTNFVSKES